MTDQAQDLQVTLLQTGDQRVDITPAVDTSEASPLGMALAGDDQTVDIDPAQ